MASIRSGIKIISDVTKFKVSSGHIIRSFSAERNTTHKTLATHARSTSLQERRSDPLTDGFDRGKPWYLQFTEHQLPAPPRPCKNTNMTDKSQSDQLKVVPPFTLAAATKFCRKACEKVDSTGTDGSKVDGEKKAIEFCKLINKKRNSKDSGKESPSSVAKNELDIKEGVADKSVRREKSAKYSVPYKENTKTDKNIPLVHNVRQNVLSDNDKKKLAIIASIKALKYPQVKGGENPMQTFYLKQKLIDKEIEKNTKKTISQPKIVLEEIESKKVSKTKLSRSKASSRRSKKRKKSKTIDEKKTVQDTTDPLEYNKNPRLHLEKEMLVTSQLNSATDKKKSVELQDSKKNLKPKDASVSLEKNMFISPQSQGLVKSNVDSKKSTSVKQTNTEKQSANSQGMSQFVRPRFYTLKELEARSFLTPSPSEGESKDVNTEKFEQPKRESLNNSTKVSRKQTTLFSRSDNASIKELINKPKPVNKSENSASPNNNDISRQPSTNASFIEKKSTNTTNMVSIDTGMQLKPATTKNLGPIAGDQQVQVRKELNNPNTTVNTHAAVNDPKGTVEVNIHFTNNSSVKSSDGKIPTMKKSLKEDSKLTDKKNSTMGELDKKASTTTANSNQGLPSKNNSENLGEKNINNNSLLTPKTSMPSMDNIASVIVQDTENTFKTKVYPKVSQDLQTTGSQAETQSSNSQSHSKEQTLLHQDKINELNTNKVSKTTNKRDDAQSQVLERNTNVASKDTKEDKTQLISNDGLNYNYSKNKFEIPRPEFDTSITHPKQLSVSKDIKKNDNKTPTEQTFEKDLEKKKTLKTSDSSQEVKDEGMIREKENKSEELFPRIPTKDLEYNYSTNKYELKKIDSKTSVNNVVQSHETTQIEIKSNTIPKKGTIILKRKVPKLDKEKPSVSKLTLQLDFNYNTNKYEPKMGKSKAVTNKKVSKPVSLFGTETGVNKEDSNKSTSAKVPTSVKETLKITVSRDPDTKNNVQKQTDVQKQSLTNQINPSEKPVHPTNATETSSKDVTKNQNLSLDNAKATSIKDDKKDFLKPGSSTNNPPTRNYSMKVSDCNPPGDGPDGDWEMIVVKQLDVKDLVPPKLYTTDKGSKSMTQVLVEPKITPLSTTVQPKTIKSNTKFVPYIPKPVFRPAKNTNLQSEVVIQKRVKASKINKNVEIPKPYPTPLVTYQWFATLNDPPNSVESAVGEVKKAPPLNKSNINDTKHENVVPQSSSKPKLQQSHKKTDDEVSFKPMRFIPEPTENVKKPKLKHTSYSNETAKSKDISSSKSIQCKPIHSDGYVRKAKPKRTASWSSVNVKTQPVKTISAHKSTVKSKKKETYKAPYPETAQTLCVKKIPCTKTKKDIKSTHVDAQNKKNLPKVKNGSKVPSDLSRKNTSKPGCQTFKMPGCRIPSSTNCSRNNTFSSTCTKVPPPRPSYSECQKKPSPPNPKTECKTSNVLQPSYPIMSNKDFKLPKALVASAINPDLAACCDSRKEQARDPFECGKTTLLFPGLAKGSKSSKRGKTLEINEDGSRIVRLIKALMDLFRLKAVGIKQEIEEKNGNKLLTSNATVHCQRNTEKYRNELREKIQKQYKSKESIVAKLRNIPDLDTTDPNPAKPISPCHSNNKFRRNKKLKKLSTGPVKSPIVCPKIAAPGCQPRARTSCEKEIFRPECLKTLAPSPSYSECLKRPFPKIPHSECRLREDKEKAFSELRSNRMSITTRNLEDALMKCLKPKTYGCEMSKNEEKLNKLTHLCKSYDAKHVMLIDNNPDGLLREVPLAVKREEHRNEPELDLMPVQVCMPPPAKQTPGNPSCDENVESCGSFKPYKLPGNFDEKVVMKPRRIKTCPRPSPASKKDCANMPVNEHEKIKLILKKTTKANPSKAN